MKKMCALATLASIAIISNSQAMQFNTYPKVKKDEKAFFQSASASFLMATIATLKPVPFALKVFSFTSACLFAINTKNKHFQLLQNPDYPRKTLELHD